MKTLLTTSKKILILVALAAASAFTMYERPEDNDSDAPAISIENWTDVAAGYEQDFPARVLLGGLRNEAFDQILKEKNINPVAYAKGAKAAIEVFNRFRRTARSTEILATASGRGEASEPREDPDISETQRQTIWLVESLLERNAAGR